MSKDVRDDFPLLTQKRYKTHGWAKRALRAFAAQEGHAELRGGLCSNNHMGDFSEYWCTTCSQPYTIWWLPGPKDNVLLRGLIDQDYYSRLPVVRCYMPKECRI